MHVVSRDVMCVCLKFVSFLQAKPTNRIARHGSRPAAARCTEEVSSPTTTGVWRCGQRDGCRPVSTPPGQPGSTCCRSSMVPAKSRVLQTKSKEHQASSLRSQSFTASALTAWICRLQPYPTDGAIDSSRCQNFVEALITAELVDPHFDRYPPCDCTRAASASLRISLPYEAIEF